MGDRQSRCRAAKPRGGARGAQNVSVKNSPRKPQFGPFWPSGKHLPLAGNLHLSTDACDEVTINAEHFREQPSALGRWRVHLVKAHAGWLGSSVEANMHRMRQKLVTTGVVWITAVGLSLAVFATRPPCACVNHAPAVASACQHCQPSADHRTACCGSASGNHHGCECPCCEGSPADQPLTLASTAGPSPSDAGEWLDLGAPAAYFFELPDALTATGGWRSDLAAVRPAPCLTKLCRWII